MSVSSTSLIDLAICFTTQRASSVLPNSLTSYFCIFSIRQYFCFSIAISVLFLNCAISCNSFSLFPHALSVLLSTFSLDLVLQPFSQLYFHFHILSFSCLIIGVCYYPSKLLTQFLCSSKLPSHFVVLFRLNLSYNITCTSNQCCDTFFDSSHLRVFYFFIYSYFKPSSQQQILSFIHCSARCISKQLILWLFETHLPQSSQTLILIVLSHLPQFSLQCQM